MTDGHWDTSLYLSLAALFFSEILGLLAHSPARGIVHSLVLLFAGLSSVAVGNSAAAAVIAETAVRHAETVDNDTPGIEQP